MNTWIYLVLLAVVGLNAASAAEAEKTTFYVQLIRGNNDEKPPVADAKRIGPKLSKQLQPVFAWKSYWQVNRLEVPLASGQKTKVQLSKEREVEIDLTHPDKRTVIIYAQGKEVSRITRPVGEAMSIGGGDRDGKSGWFIVVRRDKPSD